MKEAWDDDSEEEDIEQVAEVLAGGWSDAPPVATPDPRPYTLHPTPYTLHPTPYTLHPTP